MSVLNCQIDRQQAGAPPLTVGDPFLLACDGDVGGTLKENAQFRFAKDEEKYTLQILKVQESTAQNFKLVVVSYRPGDYKGKTLTISDGALTVATSELSWTVNSILPPGQEVKPFPSDGPFLLSYPLWLWLVLAALVLTITGIFGWLFYQRRKRRKLKAELEKYATGLPPFSQFSKDMRAIRRRIGELKNDGEAAKLIRQIDESFRLYLIRELLVPALQVSDSEILKEIKRGYPDLFNTHKTSFRRMLSELSNAKKDIDKVKIKDCEDLSHLSRQMAEAIYATKRKTS